MGKKIQAPVAAVPAAEAEADSETIQQKKQNAKQLEKQLKSTTSECLAKLDVKQIAKAVKALQEFKKRKHAESKGLLDSAESLVTLSFTMTAVPEKPSQRPQLINIPHPFISESENSRVCVFVKDPSRAFKD